MPSKNSPKVRLSVGEGVPDLEIDTSRVSDLRIQEGPNGTPAWEIVLSDFSGELAVVNGDFAFTPDRNVLDDLEDGVGISIDDLPFLIGWNDAYRMIDLIEEAYRDGNEDVVDARIASCIAYRWGAFTAGAQIYQTDMDLRLSELEHRWIKKALRHSGAEILQNSATGQPGAWRGKHITAICADFRDEGIGLRNCDLQGVFRGSDFRGVDLTAAFLNDSDLSYCDFRGSTFFADVFTESVITNALFDDGARPKTTFVNGEEICVGPRSRVPDNERLKSSKPDEEDSKGERGLISRLRDRIVLQRYGDQIGDWRTSFEPSLNVFTIQRTKAEAGLVALHETRTLQLTGAADSDEQKVVLTAVFSLDDLVTYSDVRWISDDVLAGWEQQVREAWVSGAETTRTHAQVPLLQFGNDGSHRNMPEVLPEQNSDDEPNSDWLVPDGTAVADLVSKMSEANIDIPLLPPWAPDTLRCTKSPGWAWGTDPTLDPFEVYFFGDWEPFIRNGRQDFWMFGHRGHGSNSYGMGLISKIGNVLIAQQHGWGGVYMDPVTTTESVSKGVQAWNSTLRSLRHLYDLQEPVSDDVKYALLYSDYRGIAEILLKNEAEEDDPADPFGYPRWNQLWESHLDATATEQENGDLSDLATSENPVIATLVTHMQALGGSIPPGSYFKTPGKN